MHGWTVGGAGEGRTFRDAGDHRGPSTRAARGPSLEKQRLDSPSQRQTARVARE